MATLGMAPGILHAGLPEMTTLQQSQQGPPHISISQTPLESHISQAMPQPAPQMQQPHIPMQQAVGSDTFDTAFNVMDSVLDSRAGDTFAEEYGVAFETGQPVTGIADKAVKHSFALGIKDLADLLSKGQHSQEYFGQSGSHSLSEAADAYASLSGFMKAKTSAKQSESLHNFRDSVKDLLQIGQRITAITDRNRQSHFLQDMQASNDPIVNQIIGDATSQTDNGSAAYEYIITGKVPLGTPEPMVQKQSASLFNAIAKTLADTINNQLVSLFQRSLAGMIRADALSNSMQDGMINQQSLGQNIMKNIQTTQQKVAQIQQIVDALFSPALEAKIDQPQQHPINKMSLKRYTNLD